MFNSMFTRLVSLFLAVVLVVLGSFSFISFINMRNTITKHRMESLKDAAREIAFLSSNARYFELKYQQNIFKDYLSYKIKKVQDEYNAFVITVDSSGNIMDNFEGLYNENMEFARNLDAKLVYSSLGRILSGEEIQLQSLTATQVIFSVGVPYILNDKVQGAVFIHTDWQHIKAEYLNIAKLMVSIFIIALALSGIIAAIFTKKIIDPLESMKIAVENFSNGQFGVRAEETGSIETQQLAKSFNIMADKLQRSDQNRSEFVANVSHELRSPVTSINGYITGMLDKTISDDKIPYYLNIVSQETTRLKKLIEDLLNLSRLESEQFELSPSSFNINEAIRRVIITRIGEIEERKIDLETNFEQEPIIVIGDHDRIIQVLTNLFDNALKFVSDGGIIAFSVNIRQKKAHISIKDNGKGIAKKDLPYIFDRFYKQDKARSEIKGTGLGLAISKQIMDLHKEKIYAIESDNGAHFEFTLSLDNKGKHGNGKASGSAAEADRHLRP